MQSLGLRLLELDRSNFRFLVVLKSVRNGITGRMLCLDADGSVGLSLTMLLVSFPKSLVMLSARPEHFPVSLSDILAVVSFIDRAVGPQVDAVTFPIPIFVVPLIRFQPLARLPQSFALLLAVFELATVAAPIGPEILPMSVFLSHLEISLVEIPGGIPFVAEPMLQTISKLPLISVPIAPHVHSKSMTLAVFPLPHIAVALQTFPRPSAFLLIVEPLAIINLPIFPAKYPSSLPLASNKFSLVAVATLIQLVAHTVFPIDQPAALVNRRTAIEHDACSLPHTIQNLPIIAIILGFLNFEVLGRPELCNIDTVRAGHIILKSKQGSFKVRFDLYGAKAGLIARLLHLQQSLLLPLEPRAALLHQQYYQTGLILWNECHYMQTTLWSQMQTTLCGCYSAMVDSEDMVFDSGGQVIIQSYIL